MCVCVRKVCVDCKARVSEVYRSSVAAIILSPFPFFSFSGMQRVCCDTTALRACELASFCFLGFFRVPLAFSHPRVSFFKLPLAPTQASDTSHKLLQQALADNVNLKHVHFWHVIQKQQHTTLRLCMVSFRGFHVALYFSGGRCFWGFFFSPHISFSHRVASCGGIMSLNKRHRQLQVVCVCGLCFVSTELFVA